MEEEDKALLKISGFGCVGVLAANLILWAAVVYGIILIIEAFQ